MASITRKPDETLAQYHFRLYEEKDQLGLSNLQIADLLNEQHGTSYDESKFRKEYQAYVNIWKDMVDEKLTSNLPEDFTKELELKLLEFDKEKIKFQDQKRMMRTELRKLARLEHLMDYAKDMISAVEPIKTDIALDTSSVKEAMVVISDAHIGMSIDNAFNTYNKDIALERLTYLKEKTLDKVHKEGITKLYVVSNGDQFNGHINVTGRIDDEMNVIEQITTFTSMLQGFIVDFLEEGIEVELVVTAGNHTRIMPNKKESIGTAENFERLITVILDTAFSKYSHFSSVDDSHGINMIEVCGERIAIAHGDLEKSSNPVGRLKDLTGEDITILITGHLHNFFVREYGNALHVGVGCLGGLDNYAINGRFSGRPSQLLLTFSNNGLEEILPIYF